MKCSQLLTGRLGFALLLVGILLAGCSPAVTATPFPTQDPATFVAAAVSTLRFQMTEEALRNPTATPQPTATATETPVPITPTPQPPTLTPTVTITSAPAISAKFLTASTFPEYKNEYVPNEKFSLAVRFLNNGSSTWNPGYKLILTGFQGEATVQLDVQLGQAIEPGKAAEFDMWAYGSETLGVHIWYFQLYTPEGVPVPGGSAAFSYTSK